MNVITCILLVIGTTTSEFPSLKTFLLVVQDAWQRRIVVCMDCSMLMTNSWIHDIFMNGATDYIKQHYQDEKPFFLYLAFTDPVWLFCLYSIH